MLDFDTVNSGRFVETIRENTPHLSSGYKRRRKRYFLPTQWQPPTRTYGVVNQQNRFRSVSITAGPWFETRFAKVQKITHYTLILDKGHRTSSWKGVDPENMTLDSVQSNSQKSAPGVTSKVIYAFYYMSSHKDVWGRGDKAPMHPYLRP